MLSRLVFCFGGVAVFGLLFGSHAVADDESQFRIWNQSPLVVKGKIAKVFHSPMVGLSSPPLRNMTITLEKDATLLRGRASQPIEFRYSLRAETAPQFEIGAEYMIAATKPEQGMFQVAAIEPADVATVRIAEQAVQLPMGWSLRDGKLLSPWHGRGENYWQVGGDLQSDLVCGKTGRPALLAGDITISVEQVPPEVLHQYQNPFGDGRFRVTVSNRSDQPITVPALLTDGDTILWEDSLIISQQHQAHVLPGRKQLQQAKPLQLGVGESRSGEIDLLLLDNIDWPRGGSRVYFSFCLGEAADDNFFYYFSRLHDGVREQRRKARNQ